MRRGFKSQAKAVALSARADMGLGPAETTSPAAIADHLGVAVRLSAADELIARSRFEELQSLQSDAFSAATFRLPSGRAVIVYNPLNEPARTNSDIAHELAHLMLEHPVKTIERVGGLNFFTCDAEEEQEANWLAGCLLLPRPLLVKEARPWEQLPKTSPAAMRSASKWRPGASTPAAYCCSCDAVALPASQ